MLKIRIAGFYYLLSSYFFYAEYGMFKLYLKSVLVVLNFEMAFVKKYSGALVDFKRCPTHSPLFFYDSKVPAEHSDA